MSKRGKRLSSVDAKVEKGRPYSIEEACEVVVATAAAKFDETVDIAIRLGVDPRKADQNIRGSVPLPHGLGKTIRIAVFARADKAEEAKKAGADIIGAEDLVKRVQEGFLDFDSVVATPDMMGQVGKIGKVLGPRGLMPSPKVGTVTFDVAEAVRSLKAGRAEYRVDKNGIVHAPLGKASFGKEKILDNVKSFIAAINKAKPSTSKGIYLKSASMSVTMGPGVAVDVAPLRNVAL
jgi:large subunit ribosomal protein L1